MHSASVSVNTQLGLDGDERAVERCCWLFLDEASSCVKRGVPGDVDVGTKRDLEVNTVSCVMLRGFDERPAPALSCMLRCY